MATLTSQNPYSGEINGKFETMSDKQLDCVLATAHEAFLVWKQTSFAERTDLFLKLADLIDERNSQLARLETIEMGRLLSVAKQWLQGTANLIRWYAHNGKRFLGDEQFVQDGLTGKYMYDPLGVIYGIAPRNFPFNQVLRAAAANIFAGNTTVYKHASNVPLCAQAIEQLFVDAGFSQHIYTNIFIQSSQSEQIIAHPAVAWVNLTGWESAWSVIGSLAGKYLKPSVLELGGNDAFVLLDHSDTQAMAAAAVACRVSNGGQRCNASKRFIVLEAYYDAFVEAMAQSMEWLVLGDPMDAETTLPPIARKELVDAIHQQVTDSIAQGAKLVTWGKRLEGNFYAPTVLADMTMEMTAAKEEVFGPVASIIRSSSVEESISIANSSDYGLSAVVFGDDIEACKVVADRLQGGMIFINNPAWSKASLPFGWVKKSGYGKENGPEGLRVFTNKKAVVWSME